jgi:hypothetical protein
MAMLIALQLVPRWVSRPRAVDVAADIQELVQPENQAKGKRYL